MRRDDAEIGLSYLNARYYDPELARFISPDWFEPQQPGVGTNRYAYGLNNPIAFKDPSGNCLAGCIGDAAVVGILGAIVAFFAADAVTDTLDNGKIDGSAGPGLNNGVNQAIGALTAPDDSSALFNENESSEQDTGEVSQDAGEEDENTRQINPEKQDSSVWAGFKNDKNGRKNNGLRGKNKEVYEWDHTHKDIEVYDARGRHKGSMDPVTGEMYKDPVPGRRIEL